MKKMVIFITIIWNFKMGNYERIDATNNSGFKGEGE